MEAGARLAAAGAGWLLGGAAAPALPAQHLWCPRCPAPLVLRSRTAPSGPPRGDVPESLPGSVCKFLPQPALWERNLQGARDGCRGNRTGGRGFAVPGFWAPLGTAVGATLGGRDVHDTFVASSSQEQKVVSWGIADHFNPLCWTCKGREIRPLHALWGNLVATWNGSCSPPQPQRAWRGTMNSRVLETHLRGDRTPEERVSSFLAPVCPVLWLVWLEVERPCPGASFALAPNSSNSAETAYQVEGKFLALAGW